MSEARCRLSGALTSARTARAFARGFLDDHGLDGEPDVVLVVSELVTNAVVHGGAPVELVLRVSGPRVRVEVVDAGVRMPAVRHTSPSDDHGRGLMLVDSLARAWGIEAVADAGKQVWCEVDVS